MLGFRQKSGDWNFAGYDPFQVFEVHHQPCSILNVTVECGRHITKGWTGDLFDTPDPYIQLDMPTAPSGSKKTKHLNNQTFPKWNETFQFLFDPHKTNTLRIALVDANYTFDEELAHINFNVAMLPYNTAIKGTFYFNDTSQVDIVFLSHIDTRPVLRFSLTLSDQEKAFRNTRRRKVLEAMQKSLGEGAPQDISQVPTVAVIGSGGGFRAMTGLSGCFSALYDAGILDMATYVGGLSGSAWYISQLYSHPSWPDKSPKELQKELRANVTSSWVSNLFSARSMYRYVSNIIDKRASGQPVSFTDFFGWLVGETLLPKRLETKLSDQRAKIDNGSLPMPLYTCLHVKKHISAMIFHEWVEFTPFEIGMPKYGTFMDTKRFGSKFYRGQIVKDHPEPPLHFLQGVWGSAFTILGSRLFADNSHMDVTEMLRLENREVMEEQLKKNVDEQESESSDTSDQDTPMSETEQDDSESELKTKTPQGKIIKKEKKDYKKTGFWNGMLESACNSLLNTREGRAGMVHNFMRGLSLNHVYPYSPFDVSLSLEEDTFDEIFDPYPTDIKKLYMVDAGLTFNSPYPPFLRPQRAVDVIISFDFSARPKEISQPFEELKLAEKWARVNHVPFPKIDERVYDREGMKECYVFEEEDDPNCPIIVHFVLANLLFRKFKEPGLARETSEENKFANFNVFDDPDCPYSTFNFTYTEKSFDRLTALTEFNAKLNIDAIKEAIKKSISRKRITQRRRPIRMKDIKMLLNVTRQAKNLLKSYCSSMDSRTESDADDEDEDSDDDGGNESDDEQSNHGNNEEPIIDDMFGSFSRNQEEKPWGDLLGKDGTSRFKNIVEMAKKGQVGNQDSEEGQETFDCDSKVVSAEFDLGNGDISEEVSEANMNQNSNNCNEAIRYQGRRKSSVTFANTVYEHRESYEEAEADKYQYPKLFKSTRKVPLQMTKTESEIWGTSVSSIGPDYSYSESDELEDQNEQFSDTNDPLNDVSSTTDQTEGSEEVVNEPS